LYINSQLHQSGRANALDAVREAAAQCILDRQALGSCSAIDILAATSTLSWIGTVAERELRRVGGSSSWQFGLYNGLISYVRPAGASTAIETADQPIHRQVSRLMNNK
jgi:hypothetical protein